MKKANKLLIFLLLSTSLCFAGDDDDEVKIISSGQGYLDTRYLKLNQSTPQTITASPVFNWLTAGYLPYADSSKYLTNSPIYTDGTYVGIGTTSPLFKLHAVATDAPVIMADQYSGSPDTGFTYAPFLMRAARGTPSSPAALKTGDIMFSLSARGYDGTAFTSLGRAVINGHAAEEWTSSANGTYLAFRVTPIGSTTIREVVRFNGDGSVMINDNGESTADVRMEGGNNSNLFFLDASADRIGIGTNNPVGILDVRENTSSHTSGNYYISSYTGILSSILSGNVSMYGTSSTATFTGVAGANTMNIYGVDSSSRTYAPANIVIGGDYDATLLDSSADVNYMYGFRSIAEANIAGSSSSYGYGVFSDVHAATDTTIGTGYGNFSNIDNDGSMTTAYGYYANITGNNDPTTVYGFYGEITKGTTKWGLYLTGDVYNSLGGGLVVNEGGNDSDTRMEGDTNANLFFLDASADKIGIGTSSPAVLLHIQEDGSQAQMRLQNATSAGTAPVWNTLNARGTIDSPTAIQDNDVLGFFGFQGYDGSAYSGTKAAFAAAAIENFSSTTHGTKLKFGVTPATTTSHDYYMVLTSAGLTIGTDSEASTKLDITGASVRAWLYDTGIGDSALSRTMQGFDMTSAGMSATAKYPPAIKFGSTDPQFTTENPKFLAMIAGRATENYAADTDGGMAIDFAVCPDDVGANAVPTVGMSLTSTGLGIATTAPDNPLEINAATGGSLRLTYNDSNGSATNYSTLAVGASGQLTITASNNNFIFGNGVADTDLNFTFSGTTNSGILDWMEDENYFRFSDDIMLVGGENIILDTSTGTKIGTATTQLLGFYNATPVNQPDTVADPSGGAVQDAEARAAINAIIDRLIELGLIASS